MFASKLCVLGACAALSECATPEYSYVPTTSATIPNIRIESYGMTEIARRPETEPIDAIHVKAVISNQSAEETRFEAQEQRIETSDHRSSAAAYMLLSAAVLLPFIVVPPRSTRVVDLYYPLPAVARESSLPAAGELPGSVEVVSTWHTGQGVATQRVFVPLAPLFRPPGKAWAP